jgi:outer membrane protein OmpA-like peptidoglycan-associated protein
MPSQPNLQSPGALLLRLKKSTWLCSALLGVLAFGALNARGQAVTPSNAGVSRTAKAVTYRRGGAVKVSLQGTSLMTGAVGEAKVENKGNRVEIEANFQGMVPATKFGFEYLTFALWAVSPQGRAVNLGEVQVKNGSAQVQAITDMQTFGLVVTAEPYFAVSQPGDEVVLENADVAGSQAIGATYELVPHGVYSSSNTKIENLIFGIDRKTPVELFQARNAVRIARNANAEKYAGTAISKADQQLQQAEDAYTRKSDKKIVISMARDAVQTAEEARVISVKQKAVEESNAQAEADRRAAEERTAKARADAEAQANLRQQAEQARQQAEAAKAEAEQMKEQALQAAAEAARAKEDADRARAAAVAEQQAALAQKQAAESEAERARQAAAKAESEKADMRAQLLAQLNSILQTNDSARGLIVNMSDVLFDTGSFTLKPGAREKLAKVSGILLAHPGLTMQIEGHTDSIGSDSFNVRLSEQRADAVRDFLGEQGVSPDSVTAQGFGKAEPVATNDTPEGRQRNRRVEIVVNGDSIGASATASARPAGQSSSPQSSANVPKDEAAQPQSAK